MYLPAAIFSTLDKVHLTHKLAFNKGEKEDDDDAAAALSSSGGEMKKRRVISPDEQQHGRQNDP